MLKLFEKRFPLCFRKNYRKLKTLPLLFLVIIYWWPELVSKMAVAHHCRHDGNTTCSRCDWNKRFPSKRQSWSIFEGPGKIHSRCSLRPSLPRISLLASPYAVTGLHDSPYLLKSLTVGFDSNLVWVRSGQWFRRRWVCLNFSFCAISQIQITRLSVWKHLFNSQRGKMRICISCPPPGELIVAWGGPSYSCFCLKLKTPRGNPGSTSCIIASDMALNQKLLFFKGHWIYYVQMHVIYSLAFTFLSFSGRQDHLKPYVVTNT